MDEGLVDISTVFLFIAAVFVVSSAYSGFERQPDRHGVSRLYYILDKRRIFIFGMVAGVMATIGLMTMPDGLFSRPMNDGVLGRFSYVAHLAFYFSWPLPLIAISLAARFIARLAHRMRVRKLPRIDAPRSHIRPLPWVLRTISVSNRIAMFSTMIFAGSISSILIFFVILPFVAAGVGLAGSAIGDAAKIAFLLFGAAGVFALLMRR